jgi:antitoxin PrlF
MALAAPARRTSRQTATGGMAGHTGPSYARSTPSATMRCGGRARGRPALDPATRFGTFQAMKTTVSEKGQILIPKQLRERLGLDAGQVLECWEDQGRLVAAKAALTDPIDSVYGILKLGRPTDELIAELRGAVDEGPVPARKRRPPRAPRR